MTVLCLAVICRLVTIDVALPISFGANSPGLLYHLDSRLDWLCVLVNGEHVRRRIAIRSIASAFNYSFFTEWIQV